MHSAQSGDAEHGMLEKLAGRGFLDMTRLAASDYEIWKGSWKQIEKHSDKPSNSLTGVLLS